MKAIYWIPHDTPPRLAIVARPRGNEWLENDLAKLKRDGIEVLLSLLEPDEARDLGLQHERDFAESIGIDFVSYPIPDRTIPVDKAGFHRLITQLAELVRTGTRVGAHCRGCIGRSTVATAAILIHLGIEPAEALALIEDSRGCAVPDTPEQLKWILSFKPEP
jgi:protein-tyrosine phosphatase